MSETENRSEKIDGETKPVEVNPTADLAVPVVPEEKNLAEEIERLQQNVGEVMEKEKSVKELLDISVIRQKFAEDPELKEIKATFMLHGKNKEGKEREEEFRVVHSLVGERIDFIITPVGVLDRVIRGTYKYSRGKQELGLGADLKEGVDISGYGFYGQIMEGLLQAVDVTENSTNNEETFKAMANYGEYMPPSVFARESPLARVRRGFVCFIDMRSGNKPEEQGMFFVGVRVPEKLQEILDRAIEWEDNLYDSNQKSGFRPREAAVEIKKYLQENSDMLIEQWGGSYSSCVKLLNLQIQRFEQIDQKKDLYAPVPVEEGLATPPKEEGWLTRLRQRFGI